MVDHRLRRRWLLHSQRRQYLQHQQLVTADREDDDSITIHFGTRDTGKPNHLTITQGWNYTVRLYRPRAELMDGTWKFPIIGN